MNVFSSLARISMVSLSFLRGEILKCLLSFSLWSSQIIFEHKINKQRVYIREEKASSFSLSGFKCVRVCVLSKRVCSLLKMMMILLSRIYLFFPLLRGRKEKENLVSKSLLLKAPPTVFFSAKEENFFFFFSFVLQENDEEFDCKRQNLSSEEKKREKPRQHTCAKYHHHRHCIHTHTHYVFYYINIYLRPNAKKAQTTRTTRTTTTTSL